jgi:hypothetical protein
MSRHSRDTRRAVADRDHGHARLRAVTTTAGLASVLAAGAVAFALPGAEHVASTASASASSGSTATSGSSGSGTSSSSSTSSSSKSKSLTKASSAPSASSGTSSVTSGGS